MVSDDYFRQEIHMQMHRATSWGAKAVVINARELHSSFGDFLEPKHQPRCTDAMEQEMIDGDVVWVGTPADIVERIAAIRDVCEGLTEVSITVNPGGFAHWQAINPTPPAAAWISTLSPF